MCWWRVKNLLLGPAYLFGGEWNQASVTVRFRFFRWFPAFVLESFYLIPPFFLWQSPFFNSFTFFSWFFLHIILLHLLLIPPHRCPYFIFFSSRSLDEVSMTSRLFKYQKVTRSYRWPQRLMNQSALVSHLFSLFCVCFSLLWIFLCLIP